MSRPRGAVLRLSVQYVPVARLTMYHHGVTPGPNFPACPTTSFRGPATAARARPLGDLLKRLSQKRARVLLLVWDDLGVQERPWHLDGSLHGNRR